MAMTCSLPPVRDMSKGEAGGGAVGGAAVGEAAAAPAAVTTIWDLRVLVPTWAIL